MDSALIHLLNDPNSINYPLNYQHLNYFHLFIFHFLIMIFFLQFLHFIIINLQIRLHLTLYFNLQSFQEAALIKSPN